MHVACQLMTLCADEEQVAQLAAHDNDASNSYGEWAKWMSTSIYDGPFFGVNLFEMLQENHLEV